jgi:hypothetical protein
VEVPQVAVRREIRPSEVVLPVLLLTSMLKTKRHFHSSIIRRLLLVVALTSRVDGGIPEEHLLIIREVPSEVAVEGLLSEGPANEVEVKEEDGETGKK